MIAIVFWGYKGILLTECMDPGIKITDACSETLNKLWRSVQNKTWGVHSRFTLAVQIGYFQLPATQPRLDTEELPSLHKHERLAGYSVP